MSGGYVPSEAGVEAAARALYGAIEPGWVREQFREQARAALVAAHAVAPAPREDVAEQIAQRIKDRTLDFERDARVASLGTEGHPGTQHYLDGMLSAAQIACSFAAPAPEGCDCTELCSMGPTCPGGGLAGLSGSGCWRAAPAPETVDTVPAARLAEAWDRAHGDLCEYAAMPCLLHINPYRNSEGDTA